MKRILTFTAALCVASFAQAADFTWDGGSVNNSFWSNNTNWQSDLTPSSDLSSNFIFQGNKRRNVIVDSEQTMNSLSFASNARKFSLFGMPLNIGAGGITNDSTYAQTIQSQVNVLADQIWDVSDPAGVLNVQGSIAGNFGIEKTGAGTLVLSAVNSYTGATTISGGTFQLGTNSALPNGSELVMNGGTLDTNGYSDFVGNMTLSADSTIHFGSSAGGDHSLLVVMGTGNWDPNATLYITGWNGNPEGNGYDQLIFMGGAGALNAQQLSQIKFVDPDGMWGPGVWDAGILATGEVVPVPEPATMALGGALAGLLGLNERRRRKAKADEQA